MSFTDYASRIRLLDCFKLAIYWKFDNDITIFNMTAPSNVFDFALFPLSNLVTVPGFMSISSLVLEL